MGKLFTRFFAIEEISLLNNCSAWILKVIITGAESSIEYKNFDFLSKNANKRTIVYKESKTDKIIIKTENNK